MKRDREEKYSGEGSAADRVPWVAFTVGPSAAVRAWAYAVAFVALPVALALPWPLWARALAAMAAVGAALRVACSHGIAEGRCRGLRVALTLAGEVTVERDGRPAEIGALHPGSVVFPQLAVVRYRPLRSRFTRAVLVPADAVDPWAFRRLRVLLRAR